jgi:hypothetical protein
MNELWDCHKCAGAGVRNVGTQGYCGTHLAELHNKFNKNVFAFNGIGIQTGVMRPDYGPAQAHLQCNACDATWVGIAGEHCDWCKTSRHQLIAHQAELVTRPPDVSPDDARFGNIIQAWADRLANAVEAGLIDKPLAERLLTREVNRGN